MREDFLWTEKYRPKTIEDCVLPSATKQAFQRFVDDGQVPNLLLNGGPGMGKTTVAKALLSQLNCDNIMFNGSLNVDKDTLRVDIQRYASAVSLMGGRKYIIIDEADYLNPTHVQPALRTFMEEFSRNCGFILTCNYKNRIIPALHSRMAVVDFKVPSAEKMELGKQFLARIMHILDTEKVEYDKKVIADLMIRYFPDFRRTIGELQRYAAQTGNKIDTGILASVNDVDITDLLKLLKEKDFTAMRKWVATTGTTDTTVLFRRLYDVAATKLKPQSVPQLVIILADYQYKSAFVMDQEINTAAALTQIMVECEFQ